ncbi:MAG: hypothetical protein J5604_07540 [Bacteroidales bacterium]|nr:hypothetical protein [Bacteroidales bacterium]
MKKIFTILFATAVAALAIVSCQKNIQEETLIDKNVVENQIHFYSTGIETKTTFDALTAGKYPTLWTNSKGIKISYNKKSSVEATVVPQDPATKANFTPASSFSDDGSGSHIFYAMSPSSAQAANISSSYYSWRFEIPASQTPLDGSVDEGAQILYSKYDAGSTFPTSVPFTFKHVTSYGKLSFENLSLDGDENITSITLTASKNWVGQWYYYVATKDPNTEGDFKEASASKKITLNTNKKENIWFACAPVDLSSGGTIDISVFTNKGVFSKKITFSTTGNFIAGQVGSFTVDMSAVTRTDLVNSIAEIKALYISADKPFVANLTDALVTIVSGSNFYMQDATGGILGFTADHGLSVGDKLNGIVSGTITDYNGTKEITSFVNSASKTTGNTVTPLTVPHATLVDNFADYESKYVKVENLTVSAVSGKDITVAENATLKIRNESGKTITVGTQMNAVGAPGFYSPTSTKQVKIYSIADDDLIQIGSVINAGDQSVAVGGTVSIGATTNSPATITYTSNDETIATVNSSGVISGVKAGSTTITCSVAATGKYKATSKDITITVTSSAVTVWTDDFSGVTPYATITSLNGSVTGYTAAYSNISTTYAMTSSIRVGKASGAGTITTPVLSGITKTGANLTISFKAAGWNGKTAKITLSASTGTVTEGQTTIASESSMSGTSPSMTGTVYTFHVTGADNTTTITFTTTNSIGIDDLLIQQTN